MYPHWIILMSLTIVTDQFDDHDYCSARYTRLCQGKGEHVGCMYDKKGCGPTCENCTTVEFTEQLKHYILGFVNSKRQKVAAGLEKVRGGLYVPKPEIMMYVEWDTELAFLAQRLADQCEFVHDHCRATVRYPFAGQTVAEVRCHTGETSLQATAGSVRRALAAWWTERRRATVGQLLTGFALTSKAAVWGDFSQLAVWRLRAMGCGGVRHGAKPLLLLVCDYSHTNMLGQSTLVAGDMAPCPVHTGRTLKRYPLLCVPLRSFKLNDDWNEFDYYDQSTKANKQTTDLEEVTIVAGTSKYPARIIQLYTALRPNKPVGGYYRTMGRYSEGTTPKRRWQQSSHRPRRPGAAALLITPQSESSRRHLPASLTLDEEDLEQLFRDTGFRVHKKP